MQAVKRVMEKAVSETVMVYYFPEVLPDVQGP